MRAQAADGMAVLAAEVWASTYVLTNALTQLVPDGPPRDALVRSMSDLIREADEKKADKSRAFLAGAK